MIACFARFKRSAQCGGAVQNVGALRSGADPFSLRASQLLVRLPLRSASRGGVGAARRDGWFAAAAFGGVSAVGRHLIKGAPGSWTMVFPRLSMHRISQDRSQTLITRILADGFSGRYAGGTSRQAAGRDVRK